MKPTTSAPEIFNIFRLNLRVLLSPLKTGILGFTLFLSAQAHGNVYTCATLFNDITLTPREYSIFESLENVTKINEPLYQNYKSNEIAHALTYKLRIQEKKFRPELKRRTDQHAVNLRDQSEIMMFFQPQIIREIAKNGFLNQHLVGKSGGMNNSAVRKPVEDWYTGIRMGDSAQALELRPKSAYLNISTPEYLGRRQSVPHHQFGSVAAVFKQQVKDQSIWTAYNSLELGKTAGSVSTAKNTLGSLLNKCSNCVIGKDVLDKDFGTKNLIPLKGTFFDKRMTLLDHNSYHEALIYGQIGLAEVSHFIVLDPFQAAKLVDYGKPIYMATVEPRQGRPYYKREMLIYDGTKAADPSFEKLLGTNP